MCFFCVDSYKNVRFHYGILSAFIRNSCCAINMYDDFVCIICWLIVRQIMANMHFFPLNRDFLYPFSLCGETLCVWIAQMCGCDQATCIYFFLFHVTFLNLTVSEKRLLLWSKKCLNQRQQQQSLQQHWRVNKVGKKTHHHFCTICFITVDVVLASRSIGYALANPFI